MRLHELLKQYRKDQALTQEQMAYKIGINRCLYNQIEKGKKDIGVSTIQKIAKVLKMNPTQVTEMIKGE